MLTGPLLGRLVQIANRADELEKFLADPAILSNQATYRTYAKEFAFASRIRDKHCALESLQASKAEAEAIINGGDAELAPLAQEELESTTRELAALESDILGILIQDDNDAQRDVIIEIRAGTGGEEAALFARDLFSIYAKYAETRGWKTEIVSSSASEIGGFREVIFEVKGEDVYSALRYESGGHRVQRVPETETQGRIHTSAVTVAVLPAAEEVDFKLNESDIRIDRFCASGAGGQHVNKTASAIRLTHLPTGLVVSCQDEKSQHKNLAKAMKVLRSRLYEREVKARKAVRDAERKSQIGSGDRSDRIRTYNFPQNRVTDHRLNQNYSLQQVLEGDLEKVIADLMEMHKEHLLAELES